MDLAERSTPPVHAPARTAVARRGRGWRARWAAHGGTTLTSVVVFLAAWEAIVNLMHIPRYIVPAPSAVARQFVLHFPLIWRYTLVTGGAAPTGLRHSGPDSGHPSHLRLLSRVLARAPQPS